VLFSPLVDSGLRATIEAGLSVNKPEYKQCKRRSKLRTSLSKSTERLPLFSLVSFHSTHTYVNMEPIVIAGTSYPRSNKPALSDAQHQANYRARRKAKRQADKQAEAERKAALAERDKQVEAEKKAVLAEKDKQADQLKDLWWGMEKLDSTHMKQFEAQGIIQRLWKMLGERQTAFPSHDLIKTCPFPQAPTVDVMFKEMKKHEKDILYQDQRVTDVKSAEWTVEQFKAVWDFMSDPSADMSKVDNFGPTMASALSNYSSDEFVKEELKMQCPSLPDTYNRLGGTGWVMTLAGQITDIHVDYIWQGDLAYIVHGKKLWLSWPSTKKNRALYLKYRFEPYKMTLSAWIEQLEDLHLTFCEEGDTVVMPPGQHHAVLSCVNGGIIGAKVVRQDFDMDDYMARADWIIDCAKSSYGVKEKEKERKRKLGEVDDDDEEGVDEAQALLSDFLAEVKEWETLEKESDEPTEDQKKAMRKATRGARLKVNAYKRSLK
jgi:hypothetical protein